LATIQRILREHVPALEVRAFGSRVAWNARETSDLDLALMTDTPLTVARMADLRAAFTHADLPFRVDIVDWGSTSEAFRRVVEADYAVVAGGRNRELMSISKDTNGPRRSVPANPNEPEHETRRFGDLFSESPRNGLTRPKAMRGFGTKMVNMGELFAHARLDNVPMDRVPLSESEAGRFLLERGDLLFARQSLVLEGAGKCSLFVGDDEPVTFESHVTRVRLDQRIASPSYYFYYLQSHHGRSVVRAIVEQGAGASGIRGSDLVTLDVLWKPLPEQRAIAHILGILDDKIELNRRMNATLEAMSRALFRSWFVDFDPVRAKMEGHDPGLPKEIADLFPDRLVDSELGEIPEGWDVGTLGDIAAAPRRGIDPGQVADDTPYIGLEHMPRRSVALNDWGRAGSVSSTKTAFENRDVLFGKLRPYFHKVGVAPVNGVCSTDIVVLKARMPKWSAFILAYVSSCGFVGYASRTSTGTKMPRTSWPTMSRYALCCPAAAVAEAFQQVVSPMLERIVTNVHESRTLVFLRNTLLPKLVSGELRTHAIRWPQRGAGSPIASKVGRE
jgi:type I restriction enzyme S subunit